MFVHTHTHTCILTYVFLSYQQQEHFCQVRPTRTNNGRTAAAAEQNKAPAAQLASTSKLTHVLTRTRITYIHSYMHICIIQIFPLTRTAMQHDHSQCCADSCQNIPFVCVRTQQQQPTMGTATATSKANKKCKQNGIFK